MALTLCVNLKLVIAPSMSLVVPSIYMTLPNEKLEKLAIEAAIEMYYGNGIGLALPQVGYNISMMILSSEIDRFGESPIDAAKIQLPDNMSCYALVNPRIWKISEKLVDLFKGEGCLSLPIEMTGRVDRYSEIQLEYENLRGEKHSTTVRDHLATVVQHEIEHLNGVLFPARMKARERELIMAKYCAKYGIGYDKLDKFMNLMLQNAKNSTVMYKPDEFVSKINLDEQIQQLKEFCIKNDIDSEEILENINKLMSY